MREQRFQVPGGIELAVSAWGGSQGRTTLILHGLLEQGPAWDAVARALHRPVTAPDHRGHGLSDHIGPGAYYAFWDYVSDAAALARSLGGPVDLVGHSMGGTISVLLAAAAPELVRRLVLVEGLGPPDMRAGAVERARKALQQRHEPPGHSSFPSIEAGAARMRYFNPNIPADTAYRLAARVLRPMERDDPHVRDSYQPGRVTWRWDRKHRMRTPRPFDAELFQTYLHAIEVPVLLIDGGASRFVVDDRQQRQDCLRDARRVVIEGAGHLVHHDRPAELAGQIGAFFDA